jgi:two-component sensor histidine kinase
MAPHPFSNPAVALNMALALVATSTAPVLLLDKDFNIVAASKSFCVAFHIDPTTMVGCSLEELGSGEWKVPQLSSLLKAAAAGYAEIESYELDLVRSGHETRQLIISAKKLNYDGQENTQIVMSVADITDARAAAKLKEQLLREKEGLLRDKDVMLQELHHRVANSLQIIASVLLQSARKVRSEETRHHLHDAHLRVMSVAALQQQLAVTKQGDVQLRPYFTALCESIGASMITDHEQLKLTVTVDDSVTTADTSVSLGLIVTELVINALKHAFPDNRHGKIHVDYHARGPNWNLSVGDDGVGMPGKGASAKAGLGTSIVRALATQLSGKVNVIPTNPGTKVSIEHTFVPILMGQSAALGAV